MFAGALLFAAGLYVGAEFVGSDRGHHESGASEHYRDADGRHGDERGDPGDGANPGDDDAAHGDGGNDGPGAGEP